MTDRNAIKRAVELLLAASPAYSQAERELVLDVLDRGTRSAAVWCTAEEAAGLLGVSKRTFFEGIRAGRWPELERRQENRKCVRWLVESVKRACARIGVSASEKSGKNRSAA